MRANECRLELLLGRRVLDAEGKIVGRIEEVVADYRDGEYLVREFHVGKFAVFERLGGGMLGNGLLRLIGGNRVYDGYVIPWKLMDLSDPDRPRVTVARSELSRIDETARDGGGRDYHRASKRSENVRGVGSVNRSTW